MTKGELANAIRSAKVSEMIDALPEGGDFACDLTIHQRRPELGKGELTVYYSPLAVVVKGGE